MYPEIRNFRFSFQELNILPEQVEELMGYLPGQSPEPFPEMIDGALAKGPELCDIRGSVVISRDLMVREKEGFFSFEKIIFSVEEKMLQQISNSEGGAIFICTAGSEIGEKSRKLINEGEFMEGYILDVLGSVTVESAVEKIHDTLTSEFEGRGFKVTNRYSPGYCGWALKEQEKLFSLFPDNNCGVALSDSCLMDPVKSVSGIFGFGKKVKKHLHECRICELETCTYRTIRMNRQK